MIIEIESRAEFDLLKILANNGQPANAQNPIDELVEIADICFPEPPRTNKVLIISGMPASAVLAAGIAYKAHYAAIALHNPRLGGGQVVHSLSPDYPKGKVIHF